MHSSTAVRDAGSASSTRAFFSFISVSVAALKVHKIGTDGPFESDEVI
jgi:hypothetical protein